MLCKAIMLLCQFKKYLTDYKKCIIDVLPMYKYKS